MNANEFENTNEEFGVATTNPKHVSLQDDTGKDFIGNLTSTTVAYVSFKANTEEEKDLLFNAMNQPDEKLADHINEVIEVKDVFVEVIELTSEQTGEIQKCPRIVLIDKDGVSYQCVSIGIYNTLCKLFQVYGDARTWTKAMPLKVKQLSKGEKKFLTLEKFVAKKKTK